MILTIAMVVYNEEKNLSLIERNLALVADFHEPINVLIIDNASTDQTVQHLVRLQQKYRFELIEREQNHMGLARAQAINHALTPWVAFLDADCTLSVDWFERLQALLPNLSADVAAVGGPWKPAGSHASTYKKMFESFLGHFNMPQISLKAEGSLVLHIPTACVVYRRSDIINIGNFNNSRARVGEDLDISYRLRQIQKTLLLVSDLQFEHVLPDSLGEWFKKIFFYGEARLHMALKYRDLMSQTYILPLLYFVFWCFNAVMFSFFKGIPVVLYLAVVMITTLQWSQIRQSFKVMGYMLATHIAYSLGMVFGGILFTYSNFLKSKPSVPMSYSPQSVEETL